MPEIKDVELTTLAFMTGPFLLVDAEPAMRKSAFEGREDYEVGLQLTVEQPSTGRRYRTLLPKKKVVYHRFSALLNEADPATFGDGGLRLNFSFDPKVADVIITRAK